MTIHRSDVAAVASFVAGGGCAAYAVVLTVIWPGHSSLWNALSAALIATGGLVRVLANLKTTTTAQVEDTVTHETETVLTIPQATKGTP